MVSKNQIIVLNFVFFLVLVLSPYAKAWDNEDHEIFSLVDDLEAFEGEDVTFYSWLGLEPTATEKDINKAYRKLSVIMHPDKNPDDESKERFALLGAIATILRDPEKRDRYNFHLKRGIPKWRGTGYYYNRYRPGLETVLVGLLGLGSVVHYMVMWINYFQEKKRIRNYIHESREIAWGKRMKRQQTRKRVYVNDLAFIVEGDQVFFLTDDGEYVLDEDDVVRPGITDTLIFVLPRWFYEYTKRQFFKKKSSNTNDSDYEKEGLNSDDEQDNFKNKTRRRRGGNRRQNSKLKS